MKICWDNTYKLRLARNGHLYKGCEKLIESVCGICGDDFLGSYRRKQNYCSPECYHKSRIGKQPIKMTEEVREKISKAQLKYHLENPGIMKGDKKYGSQKEKHHNW